MGVWRLKIGEGANNPYLTSTNNFVGRQTWVFEPDGGTPEERDQVEEARQNYFKNRFRVRPCSDLLWQMQFLREKNFRQKIPQVKVRDGEEINYETVTNAIRRSAHYLSATQSSDGFWPADASAPVFYLAPWVIGLYVIGHLNTVFPAEHQKEILRYIYCHQVHTYIPTQLCIHTYTSITIMFLELMQNFIRKCHHVINNPERSIALK
uniref:Taraxerol synthase n=1 Tax=Rhizophora mucronata TaxID=61149 RepID=A0A2P2MRV4_RHIMU